jgi:hypothetical protein
MVETKKNIRYLRLFLKNFYNTIKISFRKNIE